MILIESENNYCSDSLKGICGHNRKLWKPKTKILIENSKSIILLSNKNFNRQNVAGLNVSKL